MSDINEVKKRKQLGRVINVMFNWKISTAAALQEVKLWAFCYSKKEKKVKALKS